MQENYISELQKICGAHLVSKNVPLKEHTSIKVGGNVSIMVEPDTIEKVRSCITLLQKNNIPFFVMGNGSNLIFSDEDYDGVIIKICSKLSKIEVDGEYITAEAGALLSKVASVALENSLTGLEFASGIPGTIGGAAFMNAGAYDGEMKKVIVETLNIDGTGKLVKLRGEEHDFSYRCSRIQKEGLICLKVVLKLEKGDPKEIKAKMMELNNRRREKQPLDLPSAGSVFKRPEGYFAGKLIEDCGLRGFSIGGAQISSKHCGFIVNTGNATSDDIIRLIEHIQKTVHEKTGVLLDPEVRVIRGK
ncbi:MAG: UDP-N-acetylmuramate dehydrogenase [Clostridiaceae bacterium]|nr:UDP-N-acetylmuramate dehydrogenase [Clostridiaceae bacterium]